MKISVIIPVYNVEKYLKECVESVTALKSNVEIILVDDGSTDQSGMLCDKLAKSDERIRVIHKKNGGLSSARNAGIAVASGDYLLFIDSDDFIDSEITDQMLAELSSCPDVLMGLYKNYYTDTAVSVDENSEVFKNMSGLYDIEQFLSKIPADGDTDYITAWRFIVKKALITQNDLFFFEGIYHEDEEWSQRLFLKSQNVFVKNEYFYLYRQAREGAITATVKPKNLTDRFLILEKTKKLILECENETKREYLCKRAGQLVLSNTINCHILCGEDRKNSEKTIKSNIHYLKYLASTKSKIVRLVSAVLGIKITCLLLGVVAKLK